MFNFLKLTFNHYFFDELNSLIHLLIILILIYLVTLFLYTVVNYIINQNFLFSTIAGYLKLISKLLYWIWLIFFLLIGLLVLFLKIHYLINLESIINSNNLTFELTATKVDYKIKFEDRLTKNSTFISVIWIQQILVFIVSLILNYYRSAYLITKSTLPTVIKLLIGLFLGIYVRESSRLLMNSYSIKSLNMIPNSTGYTALGFSSQYNLSILNLTNSILIILVSYLLKLIINWLKYQNFDLLNSKLGVLNLHKITESIYKLVYYFLPNLRLNKKKDLDYNNDLTNQKTNWFWDMIIIILKTIIGLNLLVIIQCWLFFYLHPIPIGWLTNN